MSVSNSSVRSQVCKAAASKPVSVGSNPTGRANFGDKLKSVLLWFVTGILGFSLSIVMGGIIGYNLIFWMATNLEPEVTVFHKMLYGIF